MIALKKNLNSTVVVAMSGGVDSSAAAAILVEKGYRVIGITLQIWPKGSEGTGQGCCSLDAVEDARRVASVLDVPHYVMNVRDDFENSVIADFIREYRNGRTPNPCVRCNERVKFQTLLEKAEVLGADFLATGHYVINELGDDGIYRLKRSPNLEKDQSYVLYMLGQKELAKLLFPLGYLSKDEAREVARDRGLVTWSKAESQEICFVGKTGYRDFLAEREPGLMKQGDILDLDGRKVGTHSGAAGFTIGQRKGIGVAAAYPLYVVATDTLANTVTVGPSDALYARSVIVEDVCWVTGNPPGAEIAVAYKVRYNMPIATGTINSEGHGKWRLVFDKPERAPAPGQAAVFYNGNTVLGGGTIESVDRV